MKGTKSPTNITGSNHNSGYYEKATRNIRNKGSGPEREDVHFGSISNVWKYNKEFSFVGFIFLFADMTSSIILFRITNVSIARLVGLDVNSVISERMMHSERTFSTCSKEQNEFQCEVHLNGGILIPFCLCSLVFQVFQVIVHPILSFKISDNGLI